MSPTIFYKGKYRFFFFSREEERMHVHVTCPEGEAKFWIEPIISLARSYNLSPGELILLQKIVEEHNDEIKNSWQDHFKS